MKTNLKFIHLLFLTLLIFSCKKEDPEPVVNNDDELEEGEIIQSDEKAILSFIFLAENNDALNEDVAATINDDNQTVRAIVPLGTDLSSLLPNVEVSEKATYSPEGAKDFTNQVEYVVTAEDGSETTYQASVTREKSSEKKILSFQFLLADNPIDNNLIGEIDEENKTITVTVPLGTDITALVPSIQVSTGATVSPEDAQDFTNEVIFTVTAEDQSSVNYEAVTILTDRDALIALYNANPNNILGWDLNDPEIGNWDGVTPISNRVRNLYLTNRGIDVIPPEIKYLTDLTVLSVGMNNLTSLPTEMVKLTKLKVLYLPHNDFFVFPPVITDITSLTNLTMSYNNLTTISPFIFRLSNLRKMDVCFNNFSALPSTIGQLTELTNLNFEGNNINIIADNIGNLNKLVELNLAQNNIQSLPSTLPDLSNLEKLYLQGNQLETVWDVLGDFQNLLELDLSDNNITAITDDVANIRSLQKLTLSRNQLQELSKSLEKIEKLTELYLDDNLLEAVPPELGNLVNLEHLHLNKNALQLIPESFGNLTNLITLKLEENKLKFIPEEVCALMDNGTTITFDQETECE